VALRRHLTGAAPVGAGLLILGVSAYVVLGIAGHTLTPRDYAAVASLYLLVAIVGPGVFFAVEQETNIPDIANSLSRVLLEASSKREAHRIGRETLRQELDGNVAVQVMIARAVHLAHSAGAKQFEDLVPADSGANER